MGPSLIRRVELAGLPERMLMVVDLSRMGSVTVGVSIGKYNTYFTNIRGKVAAGQAVEIYEDDVIATSRACAHQGYLFDKDASQLRRFIEDGGDLTLTDPAKAPEYPAGPS